MWRRREIERGGQGRQKEVTEKVKLIKTNDRRRML